MDPVFGLQGKRALVVGGGFGIGRESARLLAAQGVSIAVLDLDAARAETMAEELRRSGATACAVGADVSVPEAAATAVQEADEKLGGLDILVNIVGRNSMRTDLADIAPEQFELLLSRNLRHHLYTSGAFTRVLRARKQPGAIVMVASVAGLVGAPGLGGYAASKAALISMTKTMSAEWGPLGIRVNAVAPGVTWTDRNQWGADVQEQARKSVPMGRIGDQKEIARVILFLASDLASYVTGQTVVADGGATVVTAFDAPSS